MSLKNERAANESIRDETLSRAIRTMQARTRLAPLRRHRRVFQDPRTPSIARWIIVLLMIVCGVIWGHNILFYMFNF